MLFISAFGSDKWCWLGASWSTWLQIGRRWYGCVYINIAWRIMSYFDMKIYALFCSISSHFNRQSNQEILKMGRKSVSKRFGWTAKKTEGRKRKKIFWNFLLGLFNLFSNGTMMMMIMLMRAWIIWPSFFVYPQETCIYTIHDICMKLWHNNWGHSGYSIITH